MNYAALLVVLVVLMFAFPAMVRLTHAQGIAQSWAIAATACGAVFALALYFVRERIQRDRQLRKKIDQIRAQLNEHPNDSEAFFMNGEHIGDLLTALKLHAEALEFFEQYLALENRFGRDVPKLQARVLALKNKPT